MVALRSSNTLSNRIELQFRIRKKICRSGPSTALSDRLESIEIKIDMTTYTALLSEDTQSDFGVDFPDFPGCVTAGGTLEEARLMAA